MSDREKYLKQRLGEIREQMIFLAQKEQELEEVEQITELEIEQAEILYELGIDDVSSIFLPESENVLIIERSPQIQPPKLDGCSIQNDGDRLTIIPMDSDAKYRAFCMMPVLAEIAEINGLRGVSLGESYFTKNGEEVEEITDSEPLNLTLPIRPDREEKSHRVRLAHRTSIWANYQILPSIAIPNYHDFENWLMERGLDPYSVAPAYLDSNSRLAFAVHALKEIIENGDYCADKVADIHAELLKIAFKPPIEALAEEYLQECGSPIRFGFEIQSPLDDDIEEISFREWYNSCEKAIAAAKQYVERHRLNASWYQQFDAIANEPLRKRLTEKIRLATNF